MVNENYQVFNKATGNSILGPNSISSLWSGFGGACETGLPVILSFSMINWPIVGSSPSSRPRPGARR